MRIGPQRPVNPDAIVAPQGYRVEALITGLTFPSAISFGSGGEIYLAESGGVAGAVVSVPRVLRVDPDRSVTEIGRLDHPISGLVYRQGELFIGEDGPSPRVLRVTADGEVKIVVDGLPGGGDYGLSALSLDPSGALLFGLGTRTNSGVVGLDNLARGWVSAHPDWADVSGADLELAGVNYVTPQPGRGGARVTTGSFKSFGNRCEPSERVPGNQRCGGAIYRVPVESGAPERIAGGFRNPVGVAIAPDGRLFATEGGMEERGSRPIAAAPDSLWEVRPGGFYGWPDSAGGVPVTEPRFRLPGHPQPRRLLLNAPQVAGGPAVTFAPRSGVGRLDFAASEAFGFTADALVALSGPWSIPAFPGEAAGAGSHRVVRVDPRTGQVTDFLVNRQAVPSSTSNSGGLERPFDVRFDPSGEILYVVDLGEVQVSREWGLEPCGGTGVVWRITRVRPTLVVPEIPAAEQEPEPASEVDGPEETEEPEDAAPEFVESDTGDVASAPEPPVEAAPAPDDAGPGDGEPEPPMEVQTGEPSPPLGDSVDAVDAADAEE